jgi:hypothetical protein
VRGSPRPAIDAGSCSVRFAIRSEMSRVRGAHENAEMEWPKPRVTLLRIERGGHASTGRGLNDSAHTGYGGTLGQERYEIPS